MRLGGRDFGTAPVVMAIINRTPDSFYDRGATFGDAPAMAAVAAAVAAGADIVDIGGVKAGPGDEVTPQQESDRVVPFVAAVRAAHPDLLISVDTWRAAVGDAACAAGANLLNDAWGGVDPELAAVAAARGAGLVCTHTGGQPPRTRPHRVGYGDVMADVIARTVALAERAEALGVDRESILLDPGHDFGKNTLHSLEVTRRLPELCATGRPVLVSLSNKDFVGESLGRAVGERLPGTLGATGVAAWLGAQVFRVHNVAETRDVVDMVAAIHDGRPRTALRGLA